MATNSHTPSPRDCLSAASRLVLSIDLDEWYHSRWATGYRNSLWQDTASFFREVYAADRPRGDLIPPTRWLLKFFATDQIKATFFILGEVGEWYPELVREIAAAGHEVACHGMHHVDMSDLTRGAFAADLRRAKAILEPLAGQPVIGFRSPNLVVQPWLADVLLELGFRYDSSICPARGFRGKYSHMADCPQHPYRVGASIQEVGNRDLWEIPIPTMPWVKMPAATGIATRVFGAWWTRFALWYWSRSGDVQYYFHPYEIWHDKLPPSRRFFVRLITRRRGTYMQRAGARILTDFADRIITCKDVVTNGAATEQRQPVGRRQETNA